MDPVETRIITLRGRRVVLDVDLARIYGVPTKRFNVAIKRNRRRFPSDFAFRLTARETVNLRSQIATSRAEVPTGTDVASDEVVATRVDSRGGRRYLPWAFTEHGALMAANVLRSPRAVQMSVYVVRAFVKQREELATNATILRRLAEIDKTLIQHDGTLRVLWSKLQPLLAPPPAPPRRRIGFHAQDRVDDAPPR
jgi:hypothetical protein